MDEMLLPKWDPPLAYRRRTKTRDELSRIFPFPSSFHNRLHHFLDLLIMPADKYHPRQFTSASAPSPYDRHPSANPRLGSREAREVAVVARRETSQIQQREPVGSYEYQRAKRDLEVAEEMARGPPKRSKRKPRYHKRATEAKACVEIYTLHIVSWLTIPESSRCSSARSRRVVACRRP